LRFNVESTDRGGDVQFIKEVQDGNSLGSSYRSVSQSGRLSGVDLLLKGWSTREEVEDNPTPFRLAELDDRVLSARKPQRRNRVEESEWFCDTNSEGEVLRRDGTVIPGFYAAGEITGGIFYHNHPSSAGLMLGVVRSEPF